MSFGADRRWLDSPFDPADMNPSADSAAEPWGLTPDPPHQNYSAPHPNLYHRRSFCHFEIPKFLFGPIPRMAVGLNHASAGNGNGKRRRLQVSLMGNRLRSRCQPEDSSFLANPVS